jgi:uncharacterized protein YodC (DUF2158 family)
MAKKPVLAERPRRESLKNQIGRLATFIAGCVPGEPSRGEGAVDAAIRLIRATLGPELKVGDVVRLKSGGPEMTVSSLPVLTPGYVSVIWVAGFEKAISSGRVPVAALVAVEKKKDLVRVDRGFETRQP